MSTQSDNLIINGHSFNPKRDIAYNKPRVNKVNAKSVGILNKHTSRQLMLSTPLMLTWGINRRVDEQTGKESYDMALQFPQEGYTNEQTTRFLEALQSFEKSVKEAAVANSKLWFNKTSITDAHLEVMFHPMLQWPKNKETGEPDRSRAPTLKVKLDYWDSKFNCEIYDMDKQQLFPSDDDSASPVDLIGKASNVACIVKCGGIWIGNGKFGITWKLVQAVVKPKASVRGRCFIELTNDDKKRLEEQPEEEDDEVAEAVVERVELTHDSDDEDTQQQQEEQEEQAVPQQEVVVEKSSPAVTKKKVVRRKKD
jgi:hypothetical protein